MEYSQLRRPDEPESAFMVQAWQKTCFAGINVAAWLQPLTENHIFIKMELFRARRRFAGKGRFALAEISLFL